MVYDLFDEWCKFKNFFNFILLGYFLKVLLLLRFELYFKVGICYKSVKFCE